MIRKGIEGGERVAPLAILPEPLQSSKAIDLLMSAPSR
jgi:hypothetical protein